jgi:hypothetical protein
MESTCFSLFFFAPLFGIRFQCLKYVYLGVFPVNALRLPVFKTFEEKISQLCVLDNRKVTGYDMAMGCEKVRG